MRGWWCGRGKWCILGIIFGIILFYQILITLFIVTRFNVFLLFFFMICAFFCLFRLFWW